MEYGTGFHKFVRHYYETGDMASSITKAVQHYSAEDIYIPEKDFRQPQHLMKTCMEYASFWGQDSFQIAINNNGKPVVEERFCIKVYSAEDINIYLFGMIDVAGQEDGKPTVMDHKVTSSNDIDSYLDGYVMSPQLLTYDYAIRRLASENPDTFGQYAEPFFMIDGIFIGKYGTAKFARSVPIQFTEDKRRWFSTMLLLLCKTLAYEFQYESNALYEPTGLLNGSCDGKYFKRCEFFQVCRQDDLDTSRLILSGDFEKRQYGPQIFDEQSTEE